VALSSPICRLDQVQGGRAARRHLSDEMTASAPVYSVWPSHVRALIQCRDVSVMHMYLCLRKFKLMVSDSNGVGQTSVRADGEVVVELSHGERARLKAESQRTELLVKAFTLFVVALVAVPLLLVDASYTFR